MRVQIPWFSFLYLLIHSELQACEPKILQLNGGDLQQMCSCSLSRLSFVNIHLTADSQHLQTICYSWVKQHCDSKGKSRRAIGINWGRVWDWKPTFCTLMLFQVEPVPLQCTGAVRLTVWPSWGTLEALLTVPPHCKVLSQLRCLFHRLSPLSVPNVVHAGEVSTAYNPLVSGVL